MFHVALPIDVAFAAAPPARSPSESKSSAASSASSESARPSPADRVEAQALFDQGRDLMDQGQPAAACARFEESAKLEPGLGTRFHLAACYEALGKLASAHALFLEVAREAAARSQGPRERVARARAQRVEPRIARLTIDVPYASGEGFRVERDGVPVPQKEWGTPLPVDSGTHRIEASGKGLVAWSTEIDVPNEAGVTKVNVPPLLEQRESFFAPLSRKLGLAALGVGVGTIALGSVFVAQAISKNDASNREGCSDTDCRTAAGVSLRDAAVRAGNRATWAMGIGIVGLGAAAALFWLVPVEEEEGDRDVRLTPVADLDSASLRLSGRF